MDQCVTACPACAESHEARLRVEKSMKRQRIASEGTVDTLVVVLEDGEEAFSALQSFAQNEGISAASLTAIGAFARATVGWFDFVSKSYKEIDIREQCEVLS